MSEKELLQDINEIYLHLTEQEPTPDEEIEAREQLIEKFEFLRSINAFPLQIHLTEEILDTLHNWDTLDLWFKEVEGLATSINKFLKSTGIKKKAIQIEGFKGIEEETQDEPTNKAATNLLDITEIVSKVSEQFKGEISNLKDTIDQLKKELEGKEERIQDLSQQKPIKKIVPKKESKLVPPQIKIPSFKRPEKPPHIKVKTDFALKESEELLEPIEDEFEFIELEDKEELEEIPEITEEVLNEQIKSAESFDKPKLTPIISEEPSNELKSDISFNLAEIPQEEEESQQTEVKLTALPPEKPKIKESVEKPSPFSPLPFGKPKEMIIEEDTLKFPEKPPKLEFPFAQEPELTPIPAEEEIEAPKTEEPTFLTPIITKKPKITPISIEEIDTDSIKSSGTDLFNVFSSVAKRSSEQKVSPPPAVQKEEIIKQKKFKEEKAIPFEVVPQKIDTIPKTITPSPEPELRLAALPKDKDSLYQELIALEGRRYSLEKNYKDLSSNYGSGIIDEFEFNHRSEGLKNQLDEISSRITKIRRIIASL